MKKEKKVKQLVSNQSKLFIVVCVCLVAMIGLILGIMISAKASIFADVKDVYTLTGNYKLTQEDFDVIGKGNGNYELSYACCIDLNGYTFDLNGHNFNMISTEEGKTIKIVNGTVKNGNFTINTEKCDVVIENVNFDCVYYLNTKDSLLKLDGLDTDVSKFSVVGGELYLNNSKVSGNIDLKSDLSAYNSTITSITCENTTSTIRGEINGPVTLNSMAKVLSYAKMVNVDVNNGSELTLGKISGSRTEEVKGADVEILNVNGSSTIMVRNCANVESFNVNALANIKIAGTTSELNVNNNSTFEITKSAIIKKVEVNHYSIFDFGGSVLEFNLNNAAKLDFISSSYVKFLNANNFDSAKADISFSGKAAAINMASMNSTLSFGRDANVMYLLVDPLFNYEAVTKSKINNIEFDSKITNEIDNNINANFNMPITYVLSDCLGLGYIQYAMGGNENSTESNKDNLPKVGHDYNYKVISKPTNTATGIGRYTCACDGCNESYDIVLPMRRIVLNAPTVFDLLGIDAKEGVYNYSLEPNSYVVLNEDLSTVVSGGGEAFNLVYINKGYVDVTVDKNYEKDEVRLYGDAQIDFRYYSGISEKEKDSIVNNQASTQSDVTTHPSVAAKLQLVMRESKIYFYYDDGNVDNITTDIFDVYEMVLGLLIYEMNITNVTLDDIVSVINIVVKGENLFDQYGAGLKILINEIYNNTNLLKSIPFFNIIIEKNGTYSLNISSLFTQLNRFGDQTVAQYLDGILGAGTVSTLIDFANNFLDYTVYDIWKALVMFASNADVSEEELLADFDTILSAITKNLFAFFGEEDLDTVKKYIEIFYDEENEKYSMEKALKDNYDYTIYELIVGKLDANAPAYKREAYENEKYNLYAEISYYVNKAEDFLYDNSVYNLVAMAVNLSPNFLKTIVVGLIDKSDICNVQWDLTDEEKLNNLTISIKDPTAQKGETPKDALVINYNSNEKILKEVVVDFELPTQKCDINITYSNTQGLYVDIIVDENFKLYFDDNPSNTIFDLYFDDIESYFSLTKVEDAVKKEKEYIKYDSFADFYKSLKLISLDELYELFKEKYTYLTSTFVSYRGSGDDRITINIDNENVLECIVGGKGECCFADLTTLKDGNVQVFDENDNMVFYLSSILSDDARGADVKLAYSIGYYCQEVMTIELSFDKGVYFNIGSYDYVEVNKADYIPDNHYFFVEINTELKEKVDKISLYNDRKGILYNYIELEEAIELSHNKNCEDIPFNGYRFVVGFDIVYDEQKNIVTTNIYHDYGTNSPFKSIEIIADQNSILFNFYNFQDNLVSEGDIVYARIKLVYDSINKKINGNLSYAERKIEQCKEYDEYGQWKRYYYSDGSRAWFLKESEYSKNPTKYYSYANIYMLVEGIRYIPDDDYFELVKVDSSSIGVLYTIGSDGVVRRAANIESGVDYYILLSCTKESRADTNKKYCTIGDSRYMKDAFEFTYVLDSMFESIINRFDKFGNMLTENNAISIYKNITKDGDTEYTLSIDNDFMQYIASEIKDEEIEYDEDILVQLIFYSKIKTKKGEDDRTLSGISFKYLGNKPFGFVFNTTDGILVEYGYLEALANSRFVVTEDENPIVGKDYYYFDVSEKKYVKFEGTIFEGQTYYEEIRPTFAEYVINPLVSIFVNENNGIKLYINPGYSIFILLEYDYGDDGGVYGIQVAYSDWEIKVFVNINNGNVDICWCEDTDDQYYPFALLIQDSTIHPGKKLLTLTWRNQVYKILADYIEETETYSFEYDGRSYTGRIAFDGLNMYGYVTRDGKVVLDCSISYVETESYTTIDVNGQFFDTIINTKLYRMFSDSKEKMESVKNAGKDYVGFADKWPELFS